MPNADILEFLFATVATIVATITGLIGAFSTFRLQNIDGEITFLKGLVINKKLENEICINDFIKGAHYHLLEKIYDPNIKAVDELQKVILNNSLEKQSNELLIDVENIRKNQMLYNRMKSLTIKGFINALISVFISLLLLIFTNVLLQIGQTICFILLIYMIIVAFIFMQFVNQIKQLML